jgi:hypothetical protein
MVGYIYAETGVMAGASLFIQEDLKLTDTQVQLLIGILNVCASECKWTGRRRVHPFRSVRKH